MGSLIRRVIYYSVEVNDEPGEALRILSGLKQAGVNLLAGSGFPTGAGRARIDLAPRDPEEFQRVAEKIGIGPCEGKSAFLIQGDDRVGAIADICEKLANQGISIESSQALCAGLGRWGMLLCVSPNDYERAAATLGPEEG